MRVIDLSHRIHDKMQIYPGDRPPSIKALLNHEHDGCLVSQLTLCVHAGTHIDAPIHFVAGGGSIDAFPCERFVGTGVLIDATAFSENQMIDSGVLEPYPEEMLAGNFAIFKTGWDRHYGTDDYFLHPFLSPDCARRLVELGVLLVGIDSMSVDPTLTDSYSGSSKNDQTGVGKLHFPVHDIFLGNDVLIVENLRGLEKLAGLSGQYAFLPLKIREGDGSPVRAVFMTSG